jgi:hypothetical protein
MSAASAAGRWSRWKSALARGAQWRYLLVFVAGTLLPSALAFDSTHEFLGALFDHSPRGRSLVARLDSSALFEVLRQMNEPVGAAVVPGLISAFLVGLLVAPALAGAAVTVAQSDAPPDLSSLLGGAGKMYLRMLRMMVASAVPLGLAIAVGAALLHAVDGANKHALLESSASRTSMLAWLATGLLVWLAHSTVEVGRAYLAAEPERRSAFLAWWKGARLTVRRPLQVLGMCAGTTLAALLVASVMTAVRLRLFPSGAATIAIGFLLAQVAVASIGWGRASRLTGLVQIIRSNAPPA